MVVAYGLTSCCTSVINSPQSVYIRRAADASPSLTVHWSSNYTTKVKVLVNLNNNQINARVLIGQSDVGYCAGKPTEKSRVF